jgi:hypothetical protein
MFLTLLENIMKMKTKGIFNKDLGYDSRHPVIKYSPGAVDINSYPNWMPIVFWSAVCAVFGLIAWAVS